MLFIITWILAYSSSKERTGPLCSVKYHLRYRPTPFYASPLFPRKHLSIQQSWELKINQSIGLAWASPAFRAASTEQSTSIWSSQLVQCFFLFGAYLGFTPWHLENNEKSICSSKALLTMIMKYIYSYALKTQSQDSGLTRWQANVDHFGECVGKKKKERKQTNDTHKTKPWSFWEYNNNKNTTTKTAHLIILMFHCQIIYLSIPVQISFLELTEHQSTFAELKVLLAKIKIAILLFLSDGPTD